MYIDPFVLGILVTIGFEVGLLLVIAITQGVKRK